MCKALKGVTASAIQAASEAENRGNAWGILDWDCVAHNSCHFIDTLLSAATGGSQSITQYFPAFASAMLDPVCPVDPF